MRTKDVIKLIEEVGWVFVRQKGSHMIFEKAGAKRPLVIPNHGSKDLKKSLVFAILKQAGLRE